MKETLFMLLVEEDLEKIMQVLCHEFGIENTGGGNRVSVQNEEVALGFDVVTKEMQVEPEGFFKQQINNIWGHFHQVETEFMDVKINLLHQLKISGAFVIVNYELLSEGASEEMIFAVISQLLHHVDGLFLTEKGTRLLNKDNQLILSDSGESHVEHFYPMERPVPAHFLTDIPAEQMNRRQRSLDKLHQRDIFSPQWLPCIEGEEEAVCKTVREVALRGAALLAVSLHAEVLMTENLDVEKARSYSDNVREIFDCDEGLSEREKAFLQNSEPTQQESIHFSWQYECLTVMLWALGFVDELTFPDSICDVPAVVRKMMAFDSLQELIDAAHLRTAAELLDYADYIYRLDWACVDARVNHLPNPAAMEGGVVVERHKCLNWLIGSEGADWDGVDVST